MDNISPAKHLGMLVHDVSRLMRRQLDQKAQTIGLTSAQWRVLAYLARCEGTNQATLAEYMDMEPITLSRQLDRMEAAGLTERRRDPTDRRAHRLYLTEQARPLIAKFRTLTSGIMNEAVEGITEEEMELLSDSLMRIRNNLTGKDGEPAHLLSTSAERVAVS